MPTSPTIGTLHAGGAASESKADAVVQTLFGAHVNAPRPIRVVLHPLARSHESWRHCMARHRQNQPRQHHDGGFCLIALARLGPGDLAWRQLDQLARVNAEGGWRFTEWLHGRSLALVDMAGQSWNVAPFCWCTGSYAKMAPADEAGLGHPAGAQARITAAIRSSRISLDPSVKV